MIISKAEAIRQGLEFYCSGRPCVNGNIVPRSVKHAQCLCDECKAKRARTSKEWVSNNRDRVNARAAVLRDTPERKKRQAEWDAKRLLNDPEGMAKAKADWYKRNKERILAQKQVYRQSRKEQFREWRRKHYQANRNAQIERTKVWQAENPDYGHSYREENRDRLASLKKRYIAARTIATPKWANPFMITAFYEAAKNLTVATGVLHAVDHIVPIQSDLVCGLHCQANLRVMTSEENISKGNRYWPDMP